MTLTISTAVWSFLEKANYAHAVKVFWDENGALAQAYDDVSPEKLIRIAAGVLAARITHYSSLLSYDPAVETIMSGFNAWRDHEFREQSEQRTFL